jgi:hypothetical protein
MLSEIDVINAVSKQLESMGYEIRQRLKITQSSIDVVAMKAGSLPIELYIEAKGEVGRAGKKLESADMLSNVAEALYKAVAVLSLRGERDQVMVGIAFPENKDYQKYVQGIEPVLNQLGIAVFWVKPKGIVEIASPWGL